MDDPRHAETFAIAGASLAVAGLFLIGPWNPDLGFVANLLSAQIELAGASLPFRWVLVVSAGLLAWGGYLKFVRGRSSN
jgi:uncharacterized membrane protein YkgB